MGKFSDAVTRGRKIAADDEGRERAANEARMAAEEASAAAGKSWIDKVVRPVFDAASADLKNEKTGLGISWEPSSKKGYPSITLVIL